MLFFFDVAIKFLYSFKKGLTFFYKVVENGDFANAINFVSSLIAVMLASVMLSK